MTKPMFDPNAISPKNGCFLGLNYSVDQADIVLLQAPWDVTTSYRPGAVHGPETIIEASYQLDMFSPYVEKAWTKKISTRPLRKEWKQLSASLRSEAEKVIQKLEKGASEKDPDIKRTLDSIHERSSPFHQALRQETSDLLKMGKKVITVGGDHSVSLGPIQAHADAYPEMSLLHIDAHADLRPAYEGFGHSHASIMFNVMETTKLKKLVQIGIRDVSPIEIDTIQKSKRIKTFFDWHLKEKAYSGMAWSDVCDGIIEALSDQVYVSFDIDGLDPRFCPNTGTPVPGGFDLSQVSHLLMRIRKSGKEVIGGDLVEVAPSPTGDPWDGNVGARTLWQMCLSV